MTSEVDETEILKFYAYICFAKSRLLIIIVADKLQYRAIRLKNKEFVIFVALKPRSANDHASAADADHARLLM